MPFKKVQKIQQDLQKRIEKMIEMKKWKKKHVEIRPNSSNPSWVDKSKPKTKKCE